MREQLQTRLEELKKEFETGQNRLRELEAETAYVRETMLRISGAIQVLEQMLQESEQSAEAETRPRV
jgi:predicted nuclease with TOPRIM domain